VRQIKQGIDYSIANHMEYLARRWPKTNQLSEQQRHLYECGKDTCQTWTHQRNITLQRMGVNRCRRSRLRILEENEADLDQSSSSDDSHNSSNTDEEEATTHEGASRYKFDEGMLDIMEHVIKSIFTPAG
jgi:hypothetical protein